MTRDEIIEMMKSATAWMDLDFFRWSNRYYQGRGIWHLTDAECALLMVSAQCAAPKPETGR